MEVKIKNYINSHLRKIFRWSEEYKMCKQRSLVGTGIHKCEGCGCLIDKDALKNINNFNGEPVYPMKMAVDHKEPVIPIKGFLNDVEWSTQIISRMFPGLNGLQHLCEICHYFKTQIENKERRDFKKNG